jgi:3-isopropylmalate/(R)-2-methylmalate dehydratase small subunit
LNTLTGEEVTVNLAAQTVSVGEQAYNFAIDPEAKQMLEQGLDAIDLTLSQANAIAFWAEADRTARPWVYLETSQ